jgi:hypothetical protein
VPAHVVDARATEIIAPCGQSIRTSTDATVGWIETADRIAPFLTDVSRGGERSIDRFVPSGTVAFPRDRQLGANERIRLISLVPPRDASSLRSLFVRDITSLDAKPKMPEGKVIAMLLDGQGRAIAVSRPIAIRAGEETVAWPDADGGTSLVARLSWPRTTQQDDHVAIRATTGDDTRPPSERVDSADALFAVWYGLPAGDVRLLIDSAKVRLGQNSLTLARGSVTLFEESLRDLPELTISIGASPDEPTGPLTLTISEAIDENKTIRSLQVEPGTRYTIEFLPAALLNLNLQIGEFLLAKRVDLTSGADSDLTIPLEPLRISGTVFHGATPARATLRFVQKGKPFTVETDDRGAYIATLWQPQRYVIETILADHPDLPPFSEMVSISTSRTLDFNIPANALRARVFDAADGKPLDRGRS